MADTVQKHDDGSAGVWAGIELQGKCPPVSFDGHLIYSAGTVNVESRGSEELLPDSWL